MPVSLFGNDGGSDPATRALSVTDVQSTFVEEVYDRLGWRLDDWLFGPSLHPGRLHAIRKLNLQPGDDILEVGVGSGINATLYPRQATVTGIDLSANMLEKARRRLAARSVDNVRLLQMDASAMEFPDDSFDLVYAPYVISVCSDPVVVAREMRRVCRPGGRFVFLNHFRSANRLVARAERWLSPLSVHIGFKLDLDLPAFLAQAQLDPISIEKVNVPRIWSLVTCRKD